MVLLPRLTQGGSKLSILLAVNTFYLIFSLGSGEKQKEEEIRDDAR